VVDDLDIVLASFMKPPMNQAEKVAPRLLIDIQVQKHRLLRQEYDFGWSQGCEQLIKIWRNILIIWL